MKGKILYECVFRSMRRARLFLMASVLMFVCVYPALAVSPNPTGITGPIAVTGTPGSDATHGYPFFSAAPDIASKGYVEEEYFFSGSAKSYTMVGTSTGTASVSSASYTSRMIVRRPAQASKFNGTVIVEWLNVTAGYDIEAHWAASRVHFMREGYAWVGVDAQKGGITNSTTGLKVWSPTRYSPLNISDDKYSYDIFSQAAQAIKSPGGKNVMGGFTVKRVIAAGASQSAMYLTNYYNGVHAHSRGGVFDGFFILIGGGSLRTNLSTPVFKLYSETEIPSGTRQNDSSVFRLWEVAGASHMPYEAELYQAPLRARDGIADSSTSCTKTPFSHIPFSYAQNAAYNHLVKWIVSGTLPPTATKITTTGTLTRTITRDSYGNAKGGLRLSEHDVATAVNTGANSGSGTFCSLYGSYAPFTSAQLKSLYSSHDAYVTAVTGSVKNLVSAGYVLQADADISIATARAASIP